MPPTSSIPSCQTPSPVGPLRNLAAESGATAVRLLAYLCGVGMLALIAADLIATAAPRIAASALTAIIKPPAVSAVAESSGGAETYPASPRYDDGRLAELRGSL
jgi:hypothetical protein